MKKIPLVAMAAIALALLTASFTAAAYSPTLSCMFNSYTTKWTVGTKTCTGGISGYSFYSVPVNHSTQINSLKWGTNGSFIIGGTALAVCDANKVRAILAAPRPLNCRSGTPAQNDQCTLAAAGSKALTTIPKTCTSP